MTRPVLDATRRTEELASGNREAFRALYDRSPPVLFGICLRLMRDPEMAQVLQEAMMRIWRKAHLFGRSKGNALAWMTVVGRNCALSRAAATPPPSLSLDDAGALASAEGVSANDPVAAADLRRCLNMLNEKYRKCVTLIYLNGLSYEELAAEIGAPVGSVKSWVHRAMRQLGICMGK